MDYKTRTRIARILLDDAIEPGSEIVVQGLVRTVRVSKNVAFIDVNDGSCMGNLQGVVLNPESFPVLEDIHTGAAVRLKGKLVPSEGKGQTHELQLSEVDLVGPADQEYPLQKKRHGFEFLREIAHLRPRTNTFGAVARMRSRLSYAIHRYYQERGFLLRGSRRSVPCDHP